MKRTLNFPRELAWVIQFYEKKAEIRNQLGATLPPNKALQREMLIALEQYAIQGLSNHPDFSKIGDE